jgi:hypothetical protein
MGESAVADRTWALVEGSARSMSALCRKVPFGLSDNRGVSVPCPWTSEASSPEGVAVGDASWDVAAPLASREVSTMGRSDSEGMSPRVTTEWAVWSCRALLFFLPGVPHPLFEVCEAINAEEGDRAVVLV